MPRMCLYTAIAAQTKLKVCVGSGVSEAPYHAISCGDFQQTRRLLCSLRFIELSFMLDQVSELILDYELALTKFRHDRDKETLQRLHEFLHFVSVNGMELHKRPSNTFQVVSPFLGVFSSIAWLHLRPHHHAYSSAFMQHSYSSPCVQTAANGPLSSAPAIVTRAMIANGSEKRLWLKYRNKKSVSHSFQCCSRQAYTNIILAQWPYDRVLHSCRSSRLEGRSWIFQRRPMQGKHVITRG